MLDFLSSISVKGVYAILLSGTTVCSPKIIENGTCLASTYLGITATACNSLGLCGCTPACFLAVGGTATCATTAGNALALCGCTPACFLGATATACCAVTAGNALCLGGALANTYAPLASPTFTGTVSILSSATKLLDICPTTATSAFYAMLQNDSTHRSLIGKDNSAGTGLLGTGGGVYALTLGTIDALPIVFATTNCERLRILSTGEVGIGTTTPILPLTVKGTDAAAATGATPNGSLMLSYLANAGYQALTMGVVNGASNHSWIQSRNTSSADFYTLSLNPNGGCVGIGTAAPIAKLDIIGSPNSFQYVEDNLVLTRPYNAGNAFLSGAALRLGAVGATTRMDIALQNANSGSLVSVSPDTTVMTLLSTGNVGIGTITPIASLQVNSNLIPFAIFGGNGYERGFAAFSWDITPDIGILYGANIGINTNATIGTNVGSRAMTILSGGNVGIGCTAPSVALDVCGAMNTSANITSAAKVIAGTGCGFYNSGFAAGINPIWAFNNANAYGMSYWQGSPDDIRLHFGCALTPPFCFNASGNMIVSGCGTATDWIATSDCRLKTCIKPISNALSVVTQLQGVSYQLCGDSKSENHLGLIAQDVQKVLPEIVSHSQPSEEDKKYGITDDKLGLKYDKLSAVLIEAIKEQQKQIKEQEKQLHCLCSELNYLRNSNI